MKSTISKISDNVQQRITTSNKMLVKIRADLEKELEND